MMVAKNQLRETSTTLPKQLKCLTHQPRKTSPFPRHLLSFPASSDPPASLSAKRPSMTIHLCHHRIRRPFRPVCFSCSSTTTQPCWQQAPQNRQQGPDRIDSDGRRSRRSDSSCTQNYQVDGSRVTINGHNRQREADRRAAKQQAAEREERHQAQFSALLAATQLNRFTMGSYVVGSALTTKIPSFSGTGDLCAYLRTFERLAKAHTIPDLYWSNKLFIKLEGQRCVSLMEPPDLKYAQPIWSQKLCGRCLGR